MTDNRSQKTYSQVRGNHSPAPTGKQQVHSQEIYKESKMNEYNKAKGEFRVSDVVIDNQKEFYPIPMKAEQEGFTMQYNNNSGGTKNLSQLSNNRNYS